MEKFEKDFDKAVLAGLGKGMKSVLKISSTKFFQGGQGAPNPPPGPLKIRSGRLRRGTQIIPPKRGPGDTWVSGLTNSIHYARIHEKGGRIVARRAKFLSFQLWDGTWRSVKSVFIPARPFLQPAVEEGQELVIKFVLVELQDTALKALA
jgi:phage gpG-like protein